MFSSTFINFLLALLTALYFFLDLKDKDGNPVTIDKATGAGMVFWSAALGIQYGVYATVQHPFQLTRWIDWFGKTWTR